MPGLAAGATWSRDGATWSREASSSSRTAGRLFRVSAGGGEPEPLGTLAEGESGRFWPQFLPDGRHYLYLSLAARPEDQGIYVGSLDSDLRKRIVATEYNAAYSRRATWCSSRTRRSWPSRSTPTSLELSGEPFPVLEQVALFKLRRAGPGRDLLRVRERSAGLAPAFHPCGAQAADLVRPVGPEARDGGRAGPLLRGQPCRPTRRAWRSAGWTLRQPRQPRDIWILDVARGTSRRLTFDPADDCGPVWSPDGSRIAFFSDRRGVREIYQKAANGSGDDELAARLQGLQPLNPEDWSADGRFLVLQLRRWARPRATISSCCPCPRPGSASRSPSSRRRPWRRWARSLPTAGGWPIGPTVAGRGEIYVTRHLAAGRARARGNGRSRRRQGWQPRWRRDGKELFYLAGSTLMAVEVEPDAASFEAATPRSLFDVPTTARD